MGVVITEGGEVGVLVVIKEWGKAGVVVIIEGSDEAVVVVCPIAFIVVDAVTMAFAELMSGFGDCVSM